MARKQEIRRYAQSTITIIGAGLTEKSYFSHLQRKFNLRIKLRPRFFGNENIDTIEQRIQTVLRDEGFAIVVFDADVTTWNDVEKRKFVTLKDKYKENGNVILCDSLPSIEYWFLLHYQYVTREFPNSSSVIEILKKYIPDYNKTEAFLSNPKWVEELCANNRLQDAYSHAKNKLDFCGSYTNIWKAMEKLNIVSKQE